MNKFDRNDAKKTASGKRVISQVIFNNKDLHPIAAINARAPHSTIKLEGLKEEDGIVCLVADIETDIGFVGNQSYQESKLPARPQQKCSLIILINTQFQLGNCIMDCSQICSSGY